VPCHPKLAIAACITRQPNAYHAQYHTEPCTSLTTITSSILATATGTHHTASFTLTYRSSTHSSLQHAITLTATLRTAATTTHRTILADTLNTLLAGYLHLGAMPVCRYCTMRPKLIDTMHKAPLAAH
jgi:hypothetical protein